MNKLDKYGDMEIEEAFHNAFNTIGAFNRINSFEVVCEQDYDRGNKIVSVEISCMADSPTIKEFKAIKDLQNISISLVHDNTQVNLGVVDVVEYNPMEYHVVYAEKDIEEEEDAVDQVNSVDGSSELEDLAGEV